MASKNNPALRVSTSATVKSKFEKLSTDPSFVVKEVEVPNADYTTPTVICRDDRGFYMTTKAYVGSSLLDPYRNKSYRRKELTTDEVNTLGVDIETANLTNEEWMKKIA